MSCCAMDRRMKQLGRARFTVLLSCVAPKNFFGLLLLKNGSWAVQSHVLPIVVSLMRRTEKEEAAGTRAEEEEMWTGRERAKSVTTDTVPCRSFYIS